MKKFCGVLDMPGLVEKANFNLHQKALRGAALTVAERSMNAAAAKVKQMSSKDAGASEERTSFPCAVTFDGTWMRRGFSSLFGVFPVFHGVLVRLLTCRS